MAALVCRAVAAMVYPLLFAVMLLLLLPPQALSIRKLDMDALPDGVIDLNDPDINSIMMDLDPSLRKLIDSPDESSYGYDALGGDWGGNCTKPTLRFQSPIDILTNQTVPVPGLGDLRKRSHYPTIPLNVTLSNDNHSVKISFPEGNRLRMPMFRVPPFNKSLTWPAETYVPTEEPPKAATFNLRQCHLHTKAEESIDGLRYDMVAHCVHTRTNPAANPLVGVFAVFFNRTKENRCNQFLGKVLSAFSDVIQQGDDDLMGLTGVDKHQFSLNEIFPEDGSYFHYYPGSLTVPPCTEGLLWYFFKQPLGICDFQFKKFHEIVDELHGEVAGNFRKKQPLNGRKVYYWQDPKPGVPI
ncbi:hypothetical protein CBR_g12072 [Chara braunii]|uniref:carbonic anhydrase n=1 Tax=Chara braunii TaxID=69332 RepID=A0A388KR04_CHABU|nr:hypothetical protein CBR_g12072 [Chara braunii]|eukprot:GBG72501.1 hypothetical protein CBR_g12072 [Chara braunii]